MGAPMVALQQKSIQWLNELTLLVRPITGRLNAEILEHLAAQLESTLTLPSSVRNHNPKEVSETLQTTLFRLIAGWHADSENMRRDVAELRELYYRTPHGEDRARILERAIQSHTTDWAQRLMDYQAVHRQFDWEAMEERLSQESWFLWMRQVVALEILEGLYGGFETSSSALSYEISRDHTEATIHRLFLLCKESAYPLIRRQAARTLFAFWAQLGDSDSNFFLTHRELLFKLIDDSSEDRWTRTTLIDLLGRINHDDAIEKLLRIIADTDETGDRFLLRAHAVSTYASWCEDISQLRSGFLKLACDSTTSEYVRLSLVEATKSIRASNGLEFILELAEAENGRPDSSAIVRGRLVESLCRRMKISEEDEYSNHQASNYIVWWATRDPSAMVRRVAQEELENLLPFLEQANQLSCFKHIVQGLVRKLSFDSYPGEAERICGVLESVRIASSAHLSDLRLELKAIIAEMKWGQIKKIPIPSGCDLSEVMRILASISRHDIGLYAKCESDILYLMRGERFRFSIWRSLHEIKNTKPRKRPDISHARGRSYYFPHRAHPEILAEINPTEVPGERRFIEAEGGWARYIPSIDDLIGACQTPIYLYSNMGITRIEPPKGSHAFLALKLSWLYAELNMERYQALRSTETFRQSLFIKKLRDQFGFTCEFIPHRFVLHETSIDLSTSRTRGFFSGDAQP
jgi:HEAT repeat protein